MRILYLLRNAEGGIRTHVETLIRGAISQGHDVLLITDLTQADVAFQQSLASNPELRKRVVSIKMKSAPGPWDLTTLWLLFIGLKSARSRDGIPFDVVHGHGAKGGLFARLCRVLGIVPKSTRVVYTPHGGSLHAMHGAAMNRIYVWIEKWLAKSTDLVLLESRYTMEQYATRVGDKAAPMILNRNGITELEPDLSEWPKELGFSKPLRIGAFGLLRPIKGFDFLIQAVDLVRKRGFQVELDISGDGPEREALRKLIATLRLENTVRIHRQSANALQEMRKCDIVVQPSLFESFGLVTLEAQALGRAAIASSVGGLVDIVHDKYTGLLIPPSDSAALAEAIIWMLEHPDETLTMRRLAARRAREQFSAEKMVAGAFAAYMKSPEANT